MKDAANASDDQRKPLKEHFRQVRETTERLAQPLVIEDYGLQAMGDVSPPKWHLAHTTWFFETFVLLPYMPGYRVFHPEFARLFNSYYETLGKFWPRPLRGLLSRPTVEEVYRYRQVITEAVERLIDQADVAVFPRLDDIVVLGIHHEQQHQELFMTDIKYNLSINPLKPAYLPHRESEPRQTATAEWSSFPGGLVEIGHNGEGFGFDNELPRHRQWLDPFRMQDRLVTNGEFLAFMQDQGYHTPTLWLSLGWAQIQKEHWEAPLYWENHDGQWFRYTLAGMKPVVLEEPVCHISYFEADAYARWAQKRLVREAEWEIAAWDRDPERGNFLEEGWLDPKPAEPQTGELRQMFGDVWEWTESAYTPYPGYRPQEGALGEYNGKFMSGQQVLKGGSTVTPKNHIRASYRNFFPPEARWQFSGIRLAEDAAHE